VKALFDELRRRGVVKVGIAYAVIAWLLIQVVVSIETPLRLPDWADTLVIVLLAVGFPVALVLAWAFDRTPEGIKRAPPSAGVTGQAVQDAKSIAVLPFADMSPEHDQEYFADGITEELLNSLARIRDLRVSGRTSSFYFKGRNEDLRSIGEALGVRYILEGSVRKAGERVRITAQLIDARTDGHLWSETYDRTLSDLFVIQEEIAKSVANALQITLGVGSLGSIPGMTRNVAAYDEYLLAGVANGVDIILPTSVEAMRESLRHLERAVTLDPDFALAWAGLYFLYRNATTIMGDAPSIDAKARQALDRALTLTPDSPIVLSNIAVQKAHDGDWSGAGETQRQAFDAARKYAMTEHFSYRAALFLHMVGRVREAIDHYERVRMADPLNANSAAYLCDAYTSTNQPALALAEADRFRSYSGPRFVLVKASALMTAMVLDDRPELEARLDQLIESDPFPVIGRAMRERLDDPPAALAELRRMLGEPEYQPAFIRNIVGIWAAYFGDPQLSLDLMAEYLVAQGYRGLSFLVWREIFRDVRRLPGFKDLLRGLGLVDYWQESGNWGDFCRPVGGDDFECL